VLDAHQIAETARSSVVFAICIIIHGRDTGVDRFGYRGFKRKLHFFNHGRAIEDAEQSNAKQNVSCEPEDQGAVAAMISLIASSLSQPAGPATLATSHPSPSTSTEVGIPNAKPALLRS
jgi:hypothetical protein